MINSVRNTVLSILNKNNYGYISPSDFNLFAKQAQLDLFEDYFYSYNTQITKENARRSHSDNADIAKSILEVIEDFSEVTTLNTVASGNVFYLPRESVEGYSYYLVNSIIKRGILTSGTTTSSAAAQNLLIDSSANFTATTEDQVAVGDTVITSTGRVFITAIPNSTTLATTGLLFNASGISYSVSRPVNYNSVDVEKISRSKIQMLMNSLLTQPSDSFPAYVMQADTVELFPIRVYSFGEIEANCIRYPKEPKWTYISLSGGEPVFDSSAVDYQDFELPSSDEPNLVMKILQYAGVSIREAEVVAYTKSEEVYNEQQEQQS